MKTLILHMPGDDRRAPNVARLCETFAEAQVMDAVRGAEVIARGAAKMAAGDLAHPHYPFGIGGGELGCFLSHRAAWRKIVDEGWDHALIVEDDAEPLAALWPGVEALLARQTLSEMYIRLPAKPREAGPVLDREGQVSLVLPRRIGLQTVAQVVGRAAAARLLRASETIDRPVDTFLQMHWATGQPVHSILPCPVRELTAELGGSTIQKKTRTGGKLAREFKRMVYRAQVALRPQRP